MSKPMRHGPHTIDEWVAICDSYADENQRLSDELDRLRANYSELVATHTAAVSDMGKELDHLRAENAELLDFIDRALIDCEMSMSSPLHEEGCAILSKVRIILGKTAKEEQCP